MSDERTDAARTGENPFPGLRSFDVSENYLFFGRDEQVDCVLQKLADHRFVSVVGTSGSGKSSLVRAGVLPVLYGGYLAHAGSKWRMAIFRPGGNPMFNMAASLNAPDVLGRRTGNSPSVDATIMAATLESSSLGLVQVVRQARLKPGTNLLIVVDQFEELFRFKEHAQLADASNQAAAFVRLLLEAVQQNDVPIYVVLTLRSDFLGDCAQFRDLPEAINDGLFLIPRLRRDQTHAAITGPIAVGHGKITPRLVQQLLNDVGDNPDQLPILQHALMRTWDHWTTDHFDGEPVDLRHYEKIGGMSRALSLHADEAYDELRDDRSRIVCEKLFQALTERGGDNRGIRRPTRLRDVCEIIDATIDEVIEVVERFRLPGRSFIMPPHGHELTPDTVLDISHESLMRVWERLESWVEKDARSASMYRRLVESSALYEMQHAGLWRDPELQEAVNWRDEHHPNEAWAARYDPHWQRSIKFLDYSISRRETERREKKQRRRVVNALIAMFLIFAGTLSVWALSERSRATQSAITAVHQEKIAEEKSEVAVRATARAEVSAVLADSARRTAEEQKKIAEQKSAEALAAKVRAEQSSDEANAAQYIASTERNTALLQRALADSLKILVEQARGNVERLRYLSIAKALAIKSVQVQKSGESSLSALLALQAFTFNADNSGPALEPEIYTALYDAERSLDSATVFMPAMHSGTVRASAFSQDGASLFTAGSDGRVIEWSFAGRDIHPSIVAHEPVALRCLALNAGKTILAYAGNGAGITIVTLRHASEDSTHVLLPAKEVTACGFLPSGNRIVVLDNEGAAHIVDALSGLVERDFTSQSPFRSLAVGTDGMVACGAADGSILVSPSAGGKLQNTYQLEDHKAITALAFTSGSRLLTIGNADGTVALWDFRNPTTPSVQLAGPKSTVHTIACSATGDWIAVGCSDGRVRLWNSDRPNDPPVVLTQHEGWVRSLAMSPDGGTIISFGADRTMRLLSTHLDRLATTLRGRMTRNLTHKEWIQFVGADIPYQKTVSQLTERE